MKKVLTSTNKVGGEATKVCVFGVVLFGLITYVSAIALDIMEAKERKNCPPPRQQRGR